MKLGWKLEILSSDLKFEIEFEIKKKTRIGQAWAAARILAERREQWVLSAVESETRGRRGVSRESRRGARKVDPSPGSAKMVMQKLPVGDLKKHQIVGVFQ